MSVEITKEWIDSLIEDERPESITLDYKQELDFSQNKREAKREFLADVASFANSAGGQIIIGVTEKKENGNNTGLPDKVVGVSVESIDGYILQLDGIIKNGLQPRLAGVNIQAVGRYERGPVIVIDIKKSWNSPNMITSCVHSVFYSRGNRGKRELDYGEIRDAFLRAQDIPDRIKAFREQRISKVIAGRTPVNLKGYARTILHIIPIESFTSNRLIDVTGLDDSRSGLYPIGERIGLRSRLNLDGFLAYVKPGNQTTADGYLQIFRNGIIEAVDAYMLNASTADMNELKPYPYEKDLIHATGRYLEYIKNWEFETPVYLCLTLTGVEGYYISRPNGIHAAFVGRKLRHPIDRDVLVIPEIQLDSLTQEPDVILKPAFDMLWQSADMKGSTLYDNNGRWDGDKKVR